MKKIYIFIIAFVIISAPFAVGAVATTPTNVGITTGCGVGSVNDKQTGLGTACDFNELLKLINKVITFLLVDMVTPFAAIIFCYAGWTYLTSGGSGEAKTKANKMMTNLVIGYVIALAAWLIVYTILTSLGYKGPMFLGVNGTVTN